MSTTSHCKACNSILTYEEATLNQGICHACTNRELRAEQEEQAEGYLLPQNLTEALADYIQNVAPDRDPEKIREDIHEIVKEHNL